MTDSAQSVPSLQALAVVEAWNDAANRQDAEHLTELSDPNIEVLGPRGSGYGRQRLREWLARAGLSLTTLRAFASGNLVVLAQHGVWRSLESGEITDERDLASYY
ncbi:MAG TPA: nuclear transport factor 2 family protein, partial [Ktedonobacterales bacterium]|nr:nuclear transport factor 2 family protein [Ktedonobacterales bacterium]